MTREELAALHETMCKDARAIMRKKNSDYASDEDVFANFRRHGLYGFVVRMDDKISRLTQFVKKGSLAVEDESLADTLRDIINYYVLLNGYINEAQEKKKAQE